jgi:UDP-N-acetylglucosamine:LPS N-acetylglucosamine transferase
VTLLEDEEQRKRMSNEAKVVFPRDATQRVIAAIEQIAK